MKRVKAIVIAGGLSSRFNSLKALFKINNEFLINILIKKLLNLDVFERVIVVLGHRGKEIENVLPKKDSRINVVYNNNYKDGMFTSIKTGLLKAGSIDVLLFQVDMPFFKNETILKLLKKGSSVFNTSPVCPSFKDKNGHPLYLKKDHLHSIVNDDKIKSLKEFFKKNPRKIISIDDEGVVFDIDKKEDFNYIKNSLVVKKTFDNNLYFINDFTFPLNKKILFVRHGKQLSVGKKIFLGQTDIPLSKNGAEDTFSLLKNNFFIDEIKKLKNPIIITSTLKRARASGNILSKGLKIKAFTSTYFNELYLGLLDGKSIDLFKEKMPKEYKLRGENILEYRAPKAENFFDLKYRVFKGIKKTCELFKDNDIILVSHKGVFQVLTSLLENKNLTNDHLNNTDIDYSSFKLIK